MATIEQLSKALVNADAAGDADAARVFAAEIKKLQASSQPTVQPEEKSGLRNFGEGVLRGAAGVGRTLLSPVKGAADFISPTETTLKTLVTGEKKQNPVSSYIDRIDQGLKFLDQDNKDSGLYTAGKIGTEILATMPVGGAAAQAVRMAAPAVSTAPKLTNLLTAIETGGVRGGNMLSRVAGGSINGGLSMGLVNPDDAATGAVIGGALPGVLGIAGKLGKSAGSSGAQNALLQNQLRNDVLNQSKLAGYVVPPSDASPGLLNSALGAWSGKIKTEQAASAKNAAVTNDLVRKEFGLASDVPISRDTLAEVRNKAGQAYEAVKGIGTVAADNAYNAALDSIEKSYAGASKSFPTAVKNEVKDLVSGLRVGAFDAGDAIDMVKVLRADADKAYAGGDKLLGKANKEAAAALEDAIGRQLQASNAPSDLIKNYQDARQIIAKTYSVEKALNTAGDGVNARKLGAQLSKGKPISGDLKTAAEFANTFPKAAQDVAAPNAYSITDIGLGGFGVGASNPLLAAMMAARPAVRSTILSKPYQKVMVRPASNKLQALIQNNPNAQRLLNQSGPVLGSEYLDMQ
jgi:hypothetical protein